MNSIEKLKQQIRIKQSFLCVGLDPVMHKLPPHLLNYPDPVFEFCKSLIDATIDYAVAFKPNIAFFEALGPSGLDTLMKVKAYLPTETFNIIDAKRGDIDNTAAAYAKTYLDIFDFDAITLNPYQGLDSLVPYLDYSEKTLIVLAKTSNPGAADFQELVVDSSQLRLYQIVIQKLISRIGPDRLMFVIGANQHEAIQFINDIAPEYFILAPGLGSQGATLTDLKYFIKKETAGILANYSRTINYASSNETFAEKAREVAGEIQKEMAGILRNN